VTHKGVTDRAKDKHMPSHMTFHVRSTSRSTVHPTAPSPDDTYRAASDFRYFEQPSCPRCGETLLLPEAAQYAGEGRVRNTWVCDGCGEAFQTAIDMLQH